MLLNNDEFMANVQSVDFSDVPATAGSIIPSMVNMIRLVNDISVGNICKCGSIWSECVKTRPTKVDGSTNRQRKDWKKLHKKVA